MQKVIQTIDTIEYKSFWGLFKVFMFFNLLVSFKAWFTWRINPFYWSLVSSFIGLFFFFIFPNWFTRKIPWIWFVLILLTVVTGSLNSNSISFVFHSVSPIFPLFFILALLPRYKESFLTFIRKCLTVLVGISLIGWILFLFGIPLPYFPIGYGESETSNYQYLFENHVLFLHNIRLDDSVKRFSSVFVEPGYLGCLMAMLVYVGDFKKDKQNAVFLLALLFTLSLAAYFILVVSLIVYFLKHRKKHFGQILFGAILVLILYLFGLYYNNGNNAIKKGIIDRLEYDTYEKNIVGYNRSTEDVDDYFWNYFVKGENILLGEDRDVTSTGSVDWKTYILLHGLISFVFFICYLVYPLIRFRKNRYDLALLSLVYFMVFASTMHLAISMMYLSVFTLGVNRINVGVNRINVGVNRINVGVNRIKDGK